MKIVATLIAAAFVAASATTALAQGAGGTGGGGCRGCRCRSKRAASEHDPPELRTAHRLIVAATSRRLCREAMSAARWCSRRNSAPSSSST